MSGDMQHKLNEQSVSMHGANTPVGTMHARPFSAITSPTAATVGKQSVTDTTIRHQLSRTLMGVAAAGGTVA